MNWLRLAYLSNILILLPVCWSLLQCRDGSAPLAMEGKYEDSPGLRMLVFSLWSAILLLSCLGLMFPGALRGLLVFQVLYKSIYLVVFAWPRLWRHQWDSLPAGLIVSFLVIVVSYPVLFWMGG